MRKFIFTILFFLSLNLYSIDQEYLYMANKNGKVGFINSDGKEIIPFIFDWGFNFTENFALVRINNESFYINRKGEKISSLPNQIQIEFKDGKGATKDFPCYYIDEKGENIFQKYFGACGNFNEDIAPILLFDKSSKIFTFINSEGKIANLKAQCTYQFSEGLGAVALDNKIGFVDKFGTFSIAPQFDYDNWKPCLEDYYIFKEGFARIELNRKYGFIDRKGKIVIEPIFSQISNFSNGIAVGLTENIENIFDSKKYIYINKKGIKLFTFQAIEASPFVDGLSKIKVSNNSYIWINKLGKTILKFETQEPYLIVDEFRGELAMYIIEEKEAGYINKKGKRIFSWPLK